MIVTAAFPITETASLYVPALTIMVGCAKVWAYDIAGDMAVNCAPPAASTTTVPC